MRDLLLTGFARERGYVFIDEVQRVLPAYQAAGWQSEIDTPFTVHLHRDGRHRYLQLKAPLLAPRLAGVPVGSEDQPIMDRAALRVALDRMASHDT
ncbi:MAG: hypothetical protein R3F61_25020 [Myxococcota bacterium]